MPLQLFVKCFSKTQTIKPASTVSADQPIIFFCFLAHVYRKSFARYCLVHLQLNVLNIVSEDHKQEENPINSLLWEKIIEFQKRAFYF